MVTNAKTHYGFFLQTRFICARWWPRAHMYIEKDYLYWEIYFNFSQKYNLSKNINANFMHTYKYNKNLIVRVITKHTRFRTIINIKMNFINSDITHNSAWQI